MDGFSFEIFPELPARGSGSFLELSALSGQHVDCFCRFAALLWSRWRHDVSVWYGKVEVLVDGCCK